ncbi:hypothetical protein DFH09DRAFT_1088557 [Mycena vulgaris]|nr:hypothetical protein DFH09DRAFT_1088557 [Mycena vulgaris]
MTTFLYLIRLSTHCFTHLQALPMVNVTITPSSIPSPNDLGDDDIAYSAYGSGWDEWFTVPAPIDWGPTISLDPITRTTTVSPHLQTITASPSTPTEPPPPPQTPEPTATSPPTPAQPPPPPPRTTQKVILIEEEPKGDPPHLLP